MADLRTFTDEQARLLVNLRQRYEVWLVAEQQQASLPYDLRRKTVSGHEYLYGSSADVTDEPWDLPCSL